MLGLNTNKRKKCLIPRFEQITQVYEIWLFNFFIEFLIIVLTVLNATWNDISTESQQAGWVNFVT